MGLNSCGGRNCEVEWCTDCDRCKECCGGWYCDSCSEYYCGCGDESCCGNCNGCSNCCECIHCESCGDTFSSDDRAWCSDCDCCSECCEHEAEEEEEDNTYCCPVCENEITGFDGGSTKDDACTACMCDKHYIHFVCCEAHSRTCGMYKPRRKKELVVRDRKEVTQSGEVINVDYDNQVLPE